MFIEHIERSAKHSRTGHFMALQSPELVAPLVADFLARLDL